MTCIIAQKSAHGAVMVADTRALEGYQATEVDKIFLGFNGVAIGASGMRFMMDDFVDELQRKEGQPKDFKSFVDSVEDIVALLYKRYKPRLDLAYRWQGFQALVMGLDELSKGIPRIRVVYEEGVSEEIETFKIIGHGSEYASPFVKMLYSNVASVEEMWKGSFYSIGLIEGLELDVSVGGIPAVVVAKRNSQPRFLDYQEKAIEGAIDRLYNEWKDVTESALKGIVFNDDFSHLLSHFSDKNRLHEWVLSIRRGAKAEWKRQMEAKAKKDKEAKSPSQ